MSEEIVWKPYDVEDRGDNPCADPDSERAEIAHFGSRTAIFYVHKKGSGTAWDFGQSRVEFLKRRDNDHLVEGWTRDRQLIGGGGVPESDLKIMVEAWLRAVD